MKNMDTVEKYQSQLLEQIRFIYYDRPISEATESAYLAMPRHRFVKRYRERGTKEWHEVREENLEEHLATLYANKPLILYGEDDDTVPSTISQPSFVLCMLDMLQLRTGQTVFELGAGSGWNAALMGQLVGPEGHVYSVEFISEVAKTAAETIAMLGIRNVSVIAADGGEGYAAGAPYDRAIFTAGAYDLPRHFYEQMKDKGLLLIAIKTESEGDNLFLLRKTQDHFESVESQPAGFVQMKGKYEIDSLEPIPIETLPKWTELQHKEISKTPFWWGGKGKAGFVWRTLGIRSFLGITEPAFRAFKTEKAGQGSHEEYYFGLWDKEHGSLVLAKDDCLVSYGNVIAKDRLLQKVRQWLELGMPVAASFALKIYPSDFPLTAQKNQWIVKRQESQFLWSLEA
jgi:protein-L-isoaspartate(D-aspartate) O-methyltransferase